MFNIQAKTSNKDNINNSFPIKSILMINILKSSISTACANTILAPLNRLKILMQVMNKISINDSEKEYKIRKLVPSMFLKLFYTIEFFNLKYLIRNCKRSRILFFMAW